MVLGVLPIAIFTLGVFATTVGIVLVAGFLPVSAMPEGWWTPSRSFLVTGNGILIVLLVGGLLLFAIQELDWATAVIAGGLALLAGPPGFQQLPAALRNRPVGLVAFMGIGLAVLMVTVATTI
ncbi:hypothetical protein [Limibacillus halophilus]|uniref:Uncharacterized protein n=1 Tax=Limibacillus halophilus TaxID=1579333 RepID=A0A839SSA5_9PROT|nr:hypothetical protein [Limibacillus halophilus]MBB3064226.1 hypothetical protein [Limibacillus halophilus]